MIFPAPIKKINMKRKYKDCKTRELRKTLATKQRNGHPIVVLVDLFFQIVKLADKCDCGYKACVIYTHPGLVKKIKQIVNNN